nr:MAG TPA: hypothetical protein [Caudoviricetes sp.]
MPRRNARSTEDQLDRIYSFINFPSAELPRNEELSW